MPSLIQGLRSISKLVQEEEIAIAAEAAAVLAAVTDLIDVQCDTLTVSTRLTLGHRSLYGMLVVIGDCQLWVGSDTPHRAKPILHLGSVLSSDEYLVLSVKRSMAWLVSE